MSSHTEELRNSLSVDDNIYALPPLGVGLSPLAKQLMAATRVMQSSSTELSTPASDGAKYKQTKFDTYVLIPRLGEVKLGGFWSRLY